MAENPRPADPLEPAWTQVRSYAPETLAEDAGAKLLQGGTILRLKVMDRDCDVDVSAREVRWAEGEQEGPSAHLRILILHYLVRAGKANVANEIATFREFEGGDLYYSVFKTRAIDPIVKAFGTAHEDLRRVGEILGTEPVKMGSVGFKVHFFPKLPIVVVLWLGDEEVPPSANILFDANAGKILPTEDLSIAAEVLVHRLIDVSRA